MRAASETPLVPDDTATKRRVDDTQTQVTRIVAVRRIVGCVTSDNSVTLCVLLWARSGQERALIAYEDAVLQLVTAHSGRVLHRVRADGTDGSPLEIHLLHFASERALHAYMNDPQRASLADDRDRAIARTEVHRVTVI